MNNFIKKSLDDLIEKKKIICIKNFSIWIGQFKNKNAFLNGGFSIFLNPYFFARRGIYKKIEQNKDAIYGDVLDFGCGEKPYRSLFSCKTYIGVDLKVGDRGEVDVVYDGKVLPFSDNNFDCVFSTQVFEHVENLDFSITEINRVLKPGGLLVLTVPFAWEEHDNPHDFRRFTSYGMKKILESNNFSIEKMEKTNNYIEVIGQISATYFERFIPQFFPIKILFLLFVITPINIFFLTLSKILPKETTLFNDLFCIAKKVN